MTEILPPLPLWFVSGFDAFVLLDGHDRLQAARLEGPPPKALILGATQGGRDPSVSEAKRHNIVRGLEQQLERGESAVTVDAINQRLRWIYSSTPGLFRTHTSLADGSRHTGLDGSSESALRRSNASWPAPREVVTLTPTASE